MPIPKYVKKSKRKEYRKKHRAIAKAVKGKVLSPYAVATARLRPQYENPKKKSGKKKSRKRNK